MSAGGLYPVSSSHRQMNGWELIACGASTELVRVACRSEDAADLIAGSDQKPAKI